MDTGRLTGPITDEWVEHHFDHLSPELARELHPTLARARSLCPVARSDAHGGFWVATRYSDVLRVAQDWQTFSSELGIGVPAPPQQMKILPVTIDPAAFGAGPHRCVGSNLARMNLRIAFAEIVRRLTDIKLRPGADIEFHSTYNRAPLSVPITFSPRA
jgi:cytochrome P450